MPVHSSYTIQWGSTGRSLLFMARDDSGGGVVGLRPSSPGAKAAFVRENEPAVALPLHSLTEVDAQLMPGAYRLDLPAGVVAAGSPHVMVWIGFDEAWVAPVDIELVAYDPSDQACIGIHQLQDHKRHEFLRRALPNLTEMEFEAGMNHEKKLADFLAERGES